MDSRNLETLLWVVRLGSISAAADRLHLSQPAITRRIQELERDLQARLFERKGVRVAPTAIAQALVQNAERVLTEIAAMRSTASDRTIVRGRLRIGIAEFIGLTWFDRLLARIEDEYPELTTEIDVDLSSSLVDRLLRRELDVAFFPGPAPAESVCQTPIGSCEHRWVARADFARGHDDLSARDLAEVPIIVLPKGAALHNVVMHWFTQAGVRPTRVRTCNSLSVNTSLVRKGLGISAMPVDLVSDELASGELIALREQPPLPKIAYSAAYIPSNSFKIVPLIVAYAKEESRFSYTW
jgi:DNA-binding transcriptional LysR family regulator